MEKIRNILTSFKEETTALPTDEWEDDLLLKLLKAIITKPEDDEIEEEERLKYILMSVLVLFGTQGVINADVITMGFDFDLETWLVDMEKIDE